MSDPVVADHPAARRYEIRAGAKVLGYAEYNLVGEDAVMFTHTEIDPAEEGHGYGSRLAKAALDDVRASGRQLIPMCPFIAGYIRRHPEYLEIVRPDMRAALRL
jgi:predicted GNAT family acetyltransferase